VPDRRVVLTKLHRPRDLLAGEVEVVLVDGGPGAVDVFLGAAAEFGFLFLGVHVACFHLGGRRCAACDGMCAPRAFSGNATGVPCSRTDGLGLQEQGESRNQPRGCGIWMIMGVVY
jgi:hypothetical protein